MFKWDYKWEVKERKKGKWRENDGMDGVEDTDMCLSRTQRKDSH